MEAEQKAEYLGQITEHAAALNNARRDVETLTEFLRQEIAEAVAAGILTELGAHKLTGISRTTIRTWLGK